MKYFLLFISDYSLSKNLFYKQDKLCPYKQIFFTLYIRVRVKSCNTYLR